MVFALLVFFFFIFTQKQIMSERKYHLSSWEILKEITCLIIHQWLLIALRLKFTFLIMAFKSFWVTPAWPPCLISPTPHFYLFPSSSQTQLLATSTTPSSFSLCLCFVLSSLPEHHSLSQMPLSLLDHCLELPV